MSESELQSRLENLQLRIKHLEKATNQRTTELTEPWEELNRPIRRFVNDPFHVEKRLEFFVTPALFTLHMQILLQEISAFKAGDESGLPISLARMNSILRDDGAILLHTAEGTPAESAEQAMHAVSKNMNKLKAAVESLGNLPPSLMRRKVFVCATLVLQKLENFARTGIPVTNERRKFLEAFPVDFNFNDFSRKRQKFPGSDFHAQVNGLFEKFFGPTIIDGLQISEEISSKFPAFAVCAWAATNFGVHAETGVRKFLHKLNNLEISRKQKILEIVSSKPWLLGSVIVGSEKQIGEILSSSST